MRAPQKRRIAVMGVPELSALTVAQKAALCLGSDMWHTAPVPEHGVEALVLSDGPHGLRRQPDGGDHAGIGGSLPATCFPPAVALGSAWDPELAREVGAAIGREARAQGVAVVLGPGINIKRSPLCGRNFEYVSEDPHLAGRVGAGLVEGLQSEGVGACVKHFAANNQETDRLRVNAEVDERTLREIYLPAFEHVITTARPWTVMCAYNKVNGTYASQHRWLLTEVLREEWGFDGLVMSDWGAVADRVAALAAGLDLEMPPHLGVSDQAIVDAVADRTLPEEVLDTAVARVLQLVERARAPGGRRHGRYRAPRPGPPRRRRVHGVAAQRRGAPPHQPRAGRRRRGVRHHPALPGRGQLAGQPDPGRLTAGRAGRGAGRHRRSTTPRGSGSTTPGTMPRWPRRPCGSRPPPT